jgi:hypothetical protein
MGVAIEIIEVTGLEAFDAGLKPPSAPAPKPSS